MAVAAGGAAAWLARYAAERGLIGEADLAWAANALLDAAGETCAPDFSPAALTFDGALSALAEAAVSNGLAEDTASGRDRAAMRAMGVLAPRPSEIARRFDALAHGAGGSPQRATDWLYELSCDVGYVRRSAVARNVRWTSPTRWGELEITINRSKPEKDPRDIAEAARRLAGDGYPACQLCMENEGYAGRAASAPGGSWPARQNLRVLPIELGGERWGFQYSPYAYFREHCIAMSAEHRPMHVDRACVEGLLDAVDLFPHYFFGSNADLPVVGGSILSHDHYQGGAHDFPMMAAPASERFSLAGLPGVEASLLLWPLAVVKLASRRRDEIAEAAERVIDAWRAWSDAEAGIVARSGDGTPHNTVTPIVRRVDGSAARGGDAYEAYLALRCNVASREHPLGVFHPHAERHHVKRENIGLIEVMGLAILPPRLAGELDAVEARLVEAAAAGRSAGEALAALAGDPLSAPHAAWAAGIYGRRRAELVPGAARGVLQDEVADVFAGVLEDAGVFKWDEAGRAACGRFLAALAG